MTFRIKPNMKAVVTGAGSGFGAAVSAVLAERGVHVLVSDVDLEAAERTQRALVAAGGKAVAVRCDVGQPEQIEALAAEATKEFGAVDLLVNNAGYAVAGRVGEIPLEDWQRQVNVNLMGVVYGCHAFLPAMRARKSGAILNVASAAGLLSAIYMAPYNVTKAGVIALSETLSAEVWADNVHITALCPTFFQTQIHKSARTFAGDLDLQRSTEKLITESKWSARQIAEIALRGVERRQLYVIPQADGKLAWRLKRLLGDGFYGALSARLQAKLVSR